MGKITADSVWKSALGILKKEHPIPGGSSFSHVSKVEKAFESYREDSEDSRIKLVSKILEAYGAVYEPARSEEYNNMASILALIAAEKANGVQLDNMIRKYDPDKSKDRSFLLYFHTNLRRQFVSVAENERLMINGTPYILSKTSREKYREARKYSNAAFACNPEECTPKEFDQMLEYLNGLKKFSGTTADELKLIIEENSVRPELVFEDDDKSPIDNISDDCVTYDDYDDIEPVEIKSTDSQMYYFGMYTAHNYLGDYVTSNLSYNGETDINNIGNVLRAETEGMKEAYKSLVSSGFDSFSEGADVTCRIAVEAMKTGKDYPTMDEIAKSLGLSGAAVINRSFKKIADKLAAIIPH